MTIEDIIKNPELIEKLETNSPDYEAGRDKFFEELGAVIEQHPIVSSNEKVS
jgi:hypothetical protein